jgi:hypothetical protein
LVQIWTAHGIRSYKTMDVQQILSYRLQKLIQDNPGHCSKQIYVFTTVNHHVHDQLEQRLEQAKNDYLSELNLLIQSINRITFFMSYNNISVKFFQVLIYSSELVKM